MIAASPNSVQWEEINNVKYRFQNLKFKPEVIESLATPITRREWAMRQLMSHKNDINSVFPTAQQSRRQRRRTTSIPISSENGVDLEAPEGSPPEYRELRSQTFSDANLIYGNCGPLSGGQESMDKKIESSECNGPLFVPITHSGGEDNPYDSHRTTKALTELSSRYQETNLTYAEYTEEACSYEPTYSNVSKNTSPERDTKNRYPKDYVTFKGPFRRIVHRRHTDSNIFADSKGFSAICEQYSEQKVDEDEDDDLNEKSREELISIVKDLRSQLLLSKTCGKCGTVIAPNTS